MKNNALVCIAKNEDYYIQEWIDYHLSIGFSDIFIYCNDWQMSSSNTRVHLSQISGNKQQLNAYNNFIKTYGSKFDWALFIDVDEFINIKKFNDITDMFDSYNEYLAVGFNWRMFGDSGKSFEQDYNVLNRFTKCQSRLNQHIKTAVNLRLFRQSNLQMPQFVNPHFIDYGFYDKVTINASKTKFICGPYYDSNDLNAPCIHHYFTKTFDEWNFRRSYGRADTDLNSNIFKRTINEFYENNFNEVDNLELVR